MISMFRAFTQTWFAKAFLAFVSLGLVVTMGFSGRFHMLSSDDVVQAGSHEISESVFKRIFELNLEDQEKRSNQTITPHDAVAQGFDRAVMEFLANDQASAELTSRLGLRAAPSLLAAEIRKTPEFFDPISGKFDQRAYQLALGQMQLTSDQYLAQRTDAITQIQLLTGLNAGLKAPRTYAALVAGYEMENRSLSYLVLQPTKDLAPPPPTDAQLLAYMKAHASLLMRPEMRQLTIVRFSPKALAPSMPVDQAEVQKLYNFRKDSLTTPEKRSLVEIPAKTAADAAVAQKRLSAGDSPDAIAKALGVTAITYADAIKSGVADPQVADTAFSLPTGSVSGPIHSALGGFPVVKVTAVTPAVTPTLDSMRTQLETEVKARAAAKQAYAGSQAFDAAHKAGASLADAAKKAGFTTVTVGPVTQDGVDVFNQPVQGLSPALMKEAFNQPPGGESDSEDEGQGEYFAVRIEKVLPAGVPPLDLIRGPLTQQYVSEQVIAKLQAQADQYIARLKKGESIDAIGAAAKLHVGRLPGMTAQAAGSPQLRPFGERLLGQILQAKQGDVFSGQTDAGPLLVIKIDAVTPAPPAAAASTVMTFRPRLSQQLFQDVNQAQQEWAKQKIKPTTDIKLARAAIGATDADAPESAAAPAKGSGIAR